RMISRLIGVSFWGLKYGPYKPDQSSDNLKKINLLQARKKIRIATDPNLSPKEYVHLGLRSKKIAMLLNIHSYYSLRYGTLSLEELLAGMLTNGYDTHVLTDINNSSASLDFVRMAHKHGLNALVGMEFRAGDKLCFVAIARNEKGFKEINEYRTLLNKDHSEAPDQAPEFTHVFIVYPFEKINHIVLRDYEYIGIRPSERSKAVRLQKSLLDRCVILAPVSFREEDYVFHKQLRAIDNNLLISQLEPQQVASPDEVFIPKS